MSDSAELLSDKTLKRLGTIFIELYVDEIENIWKKTKKKESANATCIMGITPMVSCHSWHYRLCSLFISLSK